MNGQSLRIDWRARTDRGSVREHNEDRYAALPEAGVWAVADGMGGHDHGDWASESIIAAMDGIGPSDDFDAMLQACSDAVHKANGDIYKMAQDNGALMGSTVVGLVISARRFAVFWAGDSRAYLLRDGMFIQLTRDHTQVQVLIDRGLLAPEEAQSHPMSHVLAKAVGVEPVLEIDAIADGVEPGDVFLLCSDGLYGTLGEVEIKDILYSGAPAEAAERLVSRCLEVGARDNVTVVVVQAREPTRLAFAPGSGLASEDAR